MSTKLRRRTRDAFLLVISVPLLLGIVGAWEGHRYHESMDWVVHTQTVIATADQALLAVSAADEEQRGFLLTREHGFLGAYEAQKQIAERTIRELLALTRDNPGQQSRLAALNDQVGRWFGWSDRMISAGGQLTTPATLIEGQSLMQQVRTTAAAFATEEKRLLGVRLETQRTNEIVAGAFLVVALAATVGLLSWAYKLIVEYGQRRDRAEVEIRKLNSELEEKVEARTLELQQSNEQLIRSNEDLTKFAYIASHDLQEPLRTVGSYAGLLARRYQGQLDEKADSYIKFIVDGAKRMQTLVNDLLMYSRVGTQALVLERTDLAEVMNTAIGNLQSAIEASSAAITVSELPELNLDAVKMVSVFQNLIANSIKFCQPEQRPEISITAERAGSEWVVSVADNGIGFEQQYAEKIFVIFQRLHQVGAFPGTGIGLAVCKRIVEGHGGRIWATSQAGRGATFSVALPALRGEQRPVNSSSLEKRW